MFVAWFGEVCLLLVARLRGMGVGDIGMHSCGWCHLGAVFSVSDVVSRIGRVSLAVAAELDLCLLSVEWN